jgi:AcrR family transcriptional regulator
MNSLSQEEKRKAALNASWTRRRATVATKIELAALKLFLDHGLDAVTVDDIAGAAEISRRSFYRYFESPEHILTTVLCRTMDRWAQVVRARPKNESLLISFRAADAVALGFPENSEPLIMAMGVMRRSPEAWRRVTGPIQAHTTNAYKQIIAERLRAVGKSTRSAGAIAAGLTAIMIHLAEESAREHRTLDPEELEQTIEALQKLIAPPAKAKPAIRR